MNRLVRALTSLCAAVCLTAPALAQTVTGQLIATQYGQWSMQGPGANTYQWPSGVCVAQAGKQTFFPFTVGTPVKIVDADPTKTEIVTPSLVINQNGLCSIAVAPSFPHYSFRVTSATFGLQEAINSVSPLRNTVILITQDFYDAGGQHSTIMSAVGSTNVALIDQADLTCPTGSAYIWSGSAYVKQACGGGASIAFTTAALAGDGAGNGITASSAAITNSLGWIPLNPANNGSEFTSAPTVRTNLGLGTIATHPVGDFIGTGYANIVGQFTGCGSGAPYPRFDGTCGAGGSSTFSGGTITSNTNMGTGARFTLAAVSLGNLAGRSDLFDMLADCPALGYTIPTDGATDAYPATQSCIWTKLGTSYATDRRLAGVSTVVYPTFFLPKICQSQFTCTDYVFSHQLDLPWHTKLVGGGANGEASGTSPNTPTTTNLLFSPASQLSTLNVGSATLTPITVVSTVCNGTTCTITTSAAHGFTVNPAGGGIDQDEVHLSTYTTDIGLNKNFDVASVPSTTTLTIAYAGPTGTYGSSEGAIATTRGGILARGYDHIENLQVTGSYCWTQGTLSTFVLPYQHGGTAVDDGIQLGGHTTLKNVVASCFGRAGLNLDSAVYPGIPNGNLQADENKVENAFLSQNRGNGITVGTNSAGDAGVNTITQVQVRQNQLYGAFTYPLYASGWYQFLGSNNHTDLVATSSIPGGPFTGTVCTTSACVVTNTSAHGLVAGDQVALAGYSDAGLNHTFTLTATTSTTFTFAYTVAESFGATGSGNYYPGTHVWALAGDTVQGHGAAGGCVYGPSGHWDTPYCEVDQPQGSFYEGGGDGQSSVVMNPQGYVGPLGATINANAYAIQTHALTDVGSTVGGTQAPTSSVSLDIMPVDGRGSAWLTLNNNLPGANTAGATQSQLYLRRSVYGNTTGWPCFMLPGNYGVALSTSGGCFSDPLTVSGRSKYDGTQLGLFYAPNALAIGNSEGTGQPDCVITTGTAAPTTGSWKSCDMVINSTPTTTGIWAWENTTGGTPGTWTALSFPGIGNIQVALPTAAIPANTCTSAATVSMPGLATTSTFTSAWASDVSGVNGWGSTGGLVLIDWPTANTFNYKICNQTSASITPGPATINEGAR